MQSMPLISVIVPVYNTAPYLGRCLDSILGQTYKKLEVIVINDGSGDNSQVVAEQYAAKDARIRLFNQKNQGIMSVRIKGIEEANGEYIGFVDSDDWIEQDMYEKLLHNMIQHECDLVSSNVMIHLLDGKTVLGCDNYPEGIYNDLPRDVFPTMLYDYTTKWRAMNYIVSKLFHKKILLEAIKGLNKKIFYDEDTLILCAYCMACKSIHFSKDIYYHYEIREGSATRKVRDDEAQNMFLVYKNYERIFEDSPYPEIFRRQLKQYMFILIERILWGICQIKLGELSDWDFAAYHKIRGKKVVIYGAGTYGRGLYKDLIYWNCADKIVAWVDRNPEKAVRWVDEHPEEYMGKFMQRVESIENIRKIDYDYVAIAVKDEYIAREISNDLREKFAVPAEKIVWGPAYRKNIFSILSYAYL